MEHRFVYGDAPLRAIASFKLLKAALLVLAAVAARELLHPDVAQPVLHWAGILSQDRHGVVLQWLLAKITAIDPSTLRWLSAGSLLYAALFVTEGVGLLRRRRWAEALTVVTTAGLVPVEVYELARHATATKMLILALNLAIVAYLALRLRTERAEDARSGSPAAS